jgi:hypothetical protein
MTLIFGQKQALILRVVCKLLPLCGLARTREGYMLKSKGQPKGFEILSHRWTQIQYL